MATKDYTFTLAANEVRRLTIQGNFVRVHAMNVSSVGIRLGANQNSNTGTWDVQYTNFALGLGIGPLSKMFDTVELTETLGAPNILTLVIGDAPIEDNRLVGTLAVTGGLRQQGPATNTTWGVANLVANTATKIWTGNPNGNANGRVQNLTVHDLYLGRDNTVTATKCIAALAGATGATADGNNIGAYIDGLDATLDLWGIIPTTGGNVSFDQNQNV